MITRTRRCRKPLLDRTNIKTDLNDNKMSPNKSVRRSGRVRKSTEWKRTVPGEVISKAKDNENSSPLKKHVKATSDTERPKHRNVKGASVRKDLTPKTKESKTKITRSNAKAKNVEKKEGNIDKSDNQLTNVKKSKKAESPKKIQKELQIVEKLSNPKDLKQFKKNDSQKKLHKNTSPTSPKLKSKRIASKLAVTKLKNLRVSLERNAIVEEKIKQARNDIYEFTFDPTEPKVVKKGHRRFILDESGDANNSMKKVMKRIRKKEQKTTSKKEQKITSKKRVNNKKSKTSEHKFENVAGPSNISFVDKTIDKNKIASIIFSKDALGIKPQIKNKENKISKSQNVENIVNNQKEVIKNVSLPDVSNKQVILINSPENVDDIHYDDNYDLMHTPSVYNDTLDSTDNKNITHKTLQEEICDSFLEELPEETNTSLHSNLITDDVLKTLNDLKNCAEVINKKINIISNVVIRKSLNKTNNTTNSESSNPWRLNVFSKNKHTFTTKNTSFTPNYDQDIVINSTITEKFENVLSADKAKQPKVQPSILNYVASSKENKEYILPSGLFTSPRKILGELNVQASTPFHSNRKIFSPNLSVIKSGNTPVKNNVDRTDVDIQNCFGFDENDENIAPNVGRNKRILKKENLKTVLFKDDVDEIKPVIKISDETTNESDEIHFDMINDSELPSADIDLLFKDVNDDKDTKVTYLNI